MKRKHLVTAAVVVGIVVIFAIWQRSGDDRITLDELMKM